LTVSIYLNVIFGDIILCFRPRMSTSLWTCSNSLVRIGTFTWQHCCPSSLASCCCFGIACESAVFAVIHLAIQLQPLYSVTAPIKSQSHYVYCTEKYFCISGLHFRL